MICETCGETMQGDGYKTPIHCPNISPGSREPDAKPLHCDYVCGRCGLHMAHLQLRFARDYLPCPNCGKLIK